MRDLILLHGALGHPDQFAPLIELLKNDFTIHSLLFLGHGSNQQEDKGFKINDLVEQLNTFIDQEKIEDPLVFGYSMGGFVALSHALKYPKKISSILTLATKFEWSEDIALQEIKLLNPEIIEEKVPKYVAHLSKIHGVEHWRKLLLHTADMMMDIGKTSFLSQESLAKIQIPVQVMVGDKDTMVTIEETTWALKSLANSRMAVLPNTNHPFEKINLILLKHMIQDYWKK